MQVTNADCAALIAYILIQKVWIDLTERIFFLLESLFLYYSSLGDAGGAQGPTEGLRVGGELVGARLWADELGSMFWLTSGS